MTPAIEIDALTKVFEVGFLRKRPVTALEGLTLTVERGEIFGFLGPNGAGKTTTLKLLMRLIRPTSGTARILGEPIESVEMHRRIGFLPEQAYFYDYLTARELLLYYGRLSRVDEKALPGRVDDLLERVGLDPKAFDRQLRKFSKGMLQRVGLAQAIVNDPEVVFLDEPMSGLDPIGRRQVRDLILGLRDTGKTVFFSSHILSDVETISDRVAIVVKGRVELIGSPSELVAGTQSATEVTLWIGGVEAAGLERLAAVGSVVRRGDRDLTVSLPPKSDVDDYLRLAHQLGARVGAVMPRHETLEDLFIRRAQGGDDAVRDPDKAAADPGREARS
jgi:ABC-2 type transport system ATP-binding protein